MNTELYAEHRRTSQNRFRVLSCLVPRRFALSGFSLLEVLIVVAIVATLSVISFGVYTGFIRSSEVELVAKSIIFDLKQAQAKSMSGEKSLKWGVRFVNSSNDYYEIFSTPTNYDDPAKTVETTIFLSSPVYFSDPAVSSTVIFDKIRGTANALNLTILSPSGSSKIISITAAGNIY